MNTDTENINKKLTEADLLQFIGTTQYYRYSPIFRNFLLTDGTKYLADNGSCYWLFDKIASLQSYPKIKEHPKLKDIQFWNLTVSEDRSATLVCEWDENKTVYKEEIKPTDFGLKKIRIWVQPMNLAYISEKGMGWVAHLPLEY